MSDAETTERPAVAETDPIIWRRDLRTRLGLCGETLRVWIRDGRLPEPDIRASHKSTGWKLSTLHAAGFKL